jgi:hypothetical protein
MMIHDKASRDAAERKAKELELTAGILRHLASVSGPTITKDDWKIIAAALARALETVKAYDEKHKTN